MVGGEEKVVRVYIQDFEFGGVGGEQDGSKMIVSCESTLTHA